MSYDISNGNNDFNYTYNVGWMWYRAKPKIGIRVIYGLTGTEALKELKDIRTCMEDNYDEMKSKEPENGWGSYKGALEFINRLIIESLENPNLTWGGD